MKKIENEISKLENQTNMKKIILLLVMFLFVTLLFADSPPTNDGVDAVKNVFQTIYTFFTSAAVRVIAIVGVIFTGIKIITNKGNTEMMKQLIPICIACIIIGCASWFVEKFMGSAISGTDTLGGSSWY